MAQIAIPGGIRPEAQPNTAGAIAQVGSSIVNFMQKRKDEQQTLATAKANQKQTQFRAGSELYLRGSDAYAQGTSEGNKKGDHLFHMLGQNPAFIETMGGAEQVGILQQSLAGLPQKELNGVMKQVQVNVKKYNSGDISDAELMVLNGDVFKDVNIRTMVKKQIMEDIQLQTAGRRGTLKTEQDLDVFGEKEKIKAQHETQASTETQKLIEYRNTLPEEHPDRALVDAKLAKMTTTPQGMAVYDPVTGNMIMSQGNVGDVIGKRNLQNKHNEYKTMVTNARNLLSLKDEMFKIADDKIIGFTGSAVRVIDSAISQLQATANVFLDGKQVDLDTFLDPEKYKGKIPGLAGKSAAFQATAIKQAYILLSINERGGKFTEKDMENSLKQTGADAGSVNQFRSVQKQMVQNILISVNNAGKELGQAPMTLKDFGTDVSEKPVDTYTDLSDDELQQKYNEWAAKNGK